MNAQLEPCQPNSPLYNSRIVANYLRYIVRFHSHINISDLLAHANMEPYQVEDEDFWFTQEQINLFHDKLSRMTNVKNIAREVGRYAASFDSLGMMKSYALGFIDPATHCRLIANATCHFTKSCIWEAEQISPNTMRMTVTPRPGVQEKQFQCENRMGYFEAIFSLFNRKLPVIEHKECMFKGADACEYVITWPKFQSEVWARARDWIGLSLCVVSICLILFARSHVWVIPLLISGAAFFVLTKKIWAMEKTELYSAVSNLRTSANTLFDKLEASYHNTRIIHEVGLSLTGKSSIDAMLEEVTQVLERRLDYDRGMILLSDREKTKLSFAAGFGYSDQQRQAAEMTAFRLRKESKGIIVTCFRDQKAFLINDLDEIRGDLSSHSLEFAREMGVKSFVCCPIAMADEAIGVLIVDNVNTKRMLLQSDMDLLTMITPEIGIGIQNVLMTESKQRQFNSILEVLASSIDARDPLTAGHSERVTRFAVGACKELGLSEDYTEMIRVASLLHDYGKIAIKDSILKKPGSLSAAEYEEIKTHATKTKEILEKIEFEGIYREVPEIASCHHEKWDGTGYPRGVKHDEIPMGARILAVADVFEAITSKRHYRGPMPLQEAFALLESSKGSHFEPRIVDAFLRYYKGEGQRLDSLSVTSEEQTQEKKLTDKQARIRMNRPIRAA
jgi:HD-GYP domain-containing protein (c-di-GMP phosphodiesterase class II)